MKKRKQDNPEKKRNDEEESIGIKIVKNISKKQLTYKDRWCFLLFAIPELHITKEHLSSGLAIATEITKNDRVTPWTQDIELGVTRLLQKTKRKENNTHTHTKRKINKEIDQ